MNAYKPSGQESGESADERRAQWERFTMTVCGGDGGGYINVRNDSHENPGEHIYSVRVTDGEADGCSCAHAIYRGAHCKHQRAVENRPLVVASADAASASPTVTGQQVATDGGTVIETDETTDETTHDHDRPQADHWGHEVEHFDDGPVGAGEKCQCQSCGSRFEVAMIAATEDSSNQKWEEFYECQSCGATGSFRVDGEAHSRDAQRTWTGRIAYPDQ